MELLNLNVVVNAYTAHDTLVYKVTMNLFWKSKKTLGLYSFRLTDRQTVGHAGEGRPGN
jgi:hypothetical protein